MLFFACFSLISCNLKSTSSFHLMTNMNKEFILTNPKNAKKLQSFKDKNQFSWYYVHFLVDDISSIENLIKIKGNDTIIKNTYVLFLSNSQIDQISNISLIKEIFPEDKFYEESCSLEETNYLLVTTLQNYQLPTNNDKYIIERQDNSDTFIVRIDQSNLKESEFLEKKQKTIKFLTKIPEVKTITTFTKPILHNSIITGFIQKNSFDFHQLPGRGYYYLDRYLNEKGINGEGEIVTVMDTLIDFTHSMFRDDNVTVDVNTYMPNHRKIIYYGYDGSIEDLINDMTNDEHGTHVSATIAGKSNCDIDRENISYFNGNAPEAKILFAGYFNVISDRVLSSLMNTYKSNISSNSWGSSKYSSGNNYAYTRIAVYNPQAIFIFASGNNYELLGNFSIGDPGSSRNVLTVGATSDFYNNPKYSFVRKEDFKELFVAQRINRTSYLYVSGKISTEPGKEKFLAIDTSKGNQCNLVNKTSGFILYYGDYVDWMNQCNYSLFPQVYWTENKTAVIELLSNENGTEITTLPRFSINKDKQIIHADYSSSGPGHYGILKPDLVAPGSQVISAKSNAKSTTPHGCLENYDGDLRMMDGTSMSTPNVAASAALIRHYFKSGKWIEKVNLNGATTRALLINSCRHPLGSKIPDIIYGHGVVDLSTVLPIEGDFGVQITNQEISPNEKNSVEKNGHVVSTIHVNTSLNKKLQITLSYIDTLLSSDSVIPITRDLDLVVISPSNKKYLGDHLENNDTQHASTNEKVIINEDELEDGEYKIHVFGGNYIDVPYSPNERQQFAVVASGPIENGYIEFEKSNECLCDKCDQEHPGNCLCDEDKSTGSFCQAKVETINDESAKIKVDSLRIKRVKFVRDGKITSVLSKSEKPGRDATVWIGKKCHLIPAEYEMSGQTGNQTSGDEKKINVQFETNEICVAIFNINDVSAEYSIEITSESGSNESSTIETFDETSTPSTSIEIITPSLSDEIIIPTKTSDVVTATASSEIVTSASKSEVVTPTETSKIVTTSNTDEILTMSFSTQSDSGSGDDSEHNHKNKRKLVLVLSVCIGLIAVITIIIVIVVIIKKGKCALYNKYKIETSSMLLKEQLIANY